MEIPEPIAIVTRELSSNCCDNEMIFVSLCIRITKEFFSPNIQVSEIKTEIVLIIWEWIDLTV